MQGQNQEVSLKVGVKSRLPGPPVGSLQPRILKSEDASLKSGHVSEGLHSECQGPWLSFPRLDSRLRARRVRLSETRGDAPSLGCPLPARGDRPKHPALRGDVTAKLGHLPEARSPHARPVCPERPGARLN